MALTRTHNRMIADAAVNVKDFGAKGDGTTDDTAAIQAAVNAYQDVYFPPGTYKTTSTITVSTDGTRLHGQTKGGAALITSSNDIEMFKVTGDYVLFEGLRMYNDSSHTKRHIQSYDAVHMMIKECRIEGTGVNTTGSGIGFGDGAGGLGGSMGMVTDSILSHASVEVLTWDVHIMNSWIWANSKQYGVKAAGSVGNLTIMGTDFLPPQTSVPSRKASVYFTGAVTQPKVVGCYFDGNATIATGSGLLAEDGVLNLLVSNCHANDHDEDVIILDSIIAPNVSNCNFFKNNRSENGAVDIRLKDSFTQNLERPLIQGNTHLQSVAKTATAGAAIHVDAGTNRNKMRIINNTIQQPGTGGGYTDPEINLVDGIFANEEAGSLAGNGGTVSLYHVSGSEAIASGDTFETINFSANMAYEPRIDQINTGIVGGGATVILRYQQSGARNSFQVGIGPGTHTGFTLHYNVSL